MGELKARALKVLLISVLFLSASTSASMDWASVQSFLSNLIRKIPVRPYFAMTGSEFASFVSGMDQSMREQAILDQITQGNLPDFLKILKPVHLTHRDANGREVRATIFVMPDYLAIGSDQDFLSIPMGMPTAIKIATRFGFILPTRKMVDAIYNQSIFHFDPRPMLPGPRMTSTGYYLEHNRKIDAQRLTSSYPLGTLVSGHKKDVVLTNRLAHAIGRIAIYGWHRLSGVPIQPLSTVHNSNYADYSHGIRLVSEVALVEGELRSVYSLLEDSKLADVVSDEGPIPKARQWMTYGD